MSADPLRLPYPNAKFETSDIPSPNQYPDFRTLVDDLRREYRIQHPDEVPGKDVQFYLHPGKDNRSGSFEARTMREEGEYIIHCHLVTEIEDNRTVRRHYIEIPMTTFWKE